MQWWGLTSPIPFFDFQRYNFKKKEVIVMVILMYFVMLECNFGFNLFFMYHNFLLDTEGNPWTELFISWIWNPSYKNLTEGTLLHCSCFSFISWLWCFTTGLVLFLICFVSILGGKTCWAVLYQMFIYEGITHIYSGIDYCKNGWL